MIIYKVTNTTNGKVYIGKTEMTLSHRWQRHLQLARNKINRYFYDAINHYGADRFTIEAIERCSTIDQLNEREKFWIKHHQSTDKLFGYNMQEGGTGGRHSREIIERIRQKKIGRKTPAHVKLKMSLAQKGKPGHLHTLKTKQLLSSIGKTRDLTKRFKAHWDNCGGANHSMYWKKHTLEARAKMSLFRTGKTYEELFGVEEAARIKLVKTTRMKGHQHARKIR